MTDQRTASSGVGLGNVIAVIVSWSANHSVGWAILHGVLGWVYVAWHVVVG